MAHVGWFVFFVVLGKGFIAAKTIRREGCSCGD
jgi:hypothetical protein